MNFRPVGGGRLRVDVECVGAKRRTARRQAEWGKTKPAVKLQVASLETHDVREDAANGTVCYPARDLPIAERVYAPDNRSALDCLKFASALEKQLTAIVP